jgi:hypothetical protein
MEMDDVVSSLSQAVERVLVLARRAKDGSAPDESAAPTSAEAAE